MDIFTQYLITFGWALTAAVSMATAMCVGLYIFTKLNPLDEWQEVKNGNLGMAFILSSVILGMSLVVMYTITG